MLTSLEKRFEKHCILFLTSFTQRPEMSSRFHLKQKAENRTEDKLFLLMLRPDFMGGLKFPAKRKECNMVGLTAHCNI